MPKIITKIYKAPVIDRRKYKGMQVAIINNKVVASAGNSLELLKQVRKKFPRKRTQDIAIMSVPKENVMILKLYD